MKNRYEFCQLFIVVFMWNGCMGRRELSLKWYWVFKVFVNFVVYAPDVCDSVDDGVGTKHRPRERVSGVPVVRAYVLINWGLIWNCMSVYYHVISVFE